MNLELKNFFLIVLLFFVANKSKAQFFANGLKGIDNLEAINQNDIIGKSVLLANQNTVINNNITTEAHNLLYQLQTDTSALIVQAVKLFLLRHPEPMYSEKLKYELSNFYFNNKNYKTASYYYIQCVNEYLTNDQIVKKNFNMAYCYLQTGNKNAVAPLMGSIKNIKGNYYESGNYYYGLLQYYNGNYNEALNSFNRIINSTTYSKAMPYLLSEGNYKLGNKAIASQIADSFLNNNGNFENKTSLLKLRGTIAFEEKNYAEAAAKYNAYMATSNNNSTIDYYNLGFAEMQLNNYDIAIKQFKNIDATDTLYTDAQYCIGNILLKLNAKEEKYNAFKNASKSKNKIIAEQSLYNMMQYEFEQHLDSKALNNSYAYLKTFNTGMYKNECLEALISLLQIAPNKKESLNILEEFANEPKTQKPIQMLNYKLGVDAFNSKNYSLANNYLDAVLNVKTDQKLEDKSNYLKVYCNYFLNKLDIAESMANNLILKNKLPEMYLLLTQIKLRQNDFSASRQAHQLFLQNADSLFIIKNIGAVQQIESIFAQQDLIQNANSKWWENISNIATPLDKKQSKIIDSLLQDSTHNTKYLHSLLLLKSRSFPKAIDSMTQYLNKALQHKTLFNFQDSVLLFENFIQLKDTTSAALYVSNYNDADTVFNIWQLKNMMHIVIINPDLNKKIEVLTKIKQYATDDKILKDAAQIVKKITPKNKK
jgi:hypothetical protein